MYTLYRNQCCCRANPIFMCKFSFLGRLKPRFPRNCLQVKYNKENQIESSAAGTTSNRTDPSLPATTHCMRFQLWVSLKFR